MDIRCPRCGEPWDIDSIHEETANRHGADLQGEAYERAFNEVKHDFNVRGCIVLDGDGEWCRTHRKSDIAGIAAVIHEVMGDDIDGEAAAWEDAEAWGLI